MERTERNGKREKICGDQPTSDREREKERKKTNGDQPTSVVKIREVFLERSGTVGMSFVEFLDQFRRVFQVRDGDPCSIFPGTFET